jgi:acyl-CoA synthetase (NDP forming)
MPTSALRQARRANLKRFSQPQSIAFIGSRHMERSIRMCQRAGFTGQIWPVHPKLDEMAGLGCFASLQELPDVPDAAFIALSQHRSVTMIADLAEMGVPGAVCHAAGFAEVGGEQVDLQARLVQAAGEMAVLGPNCMGMINGFDGLAVWGEDGFIEPVPKKGAAIISQSGALLYSLVNVEQAYPLGYGFSIGNQAVIDVADVLDVVLDDPRVASVGIYSEGLTDGPAFAAALDRALVQGVPIALLRAGGTESAAQVSLSHTGNLAVTNDFWQALIDRYGLIRVDTPKQLIETTKLLAVSGLPAGNRVLLSSYSGAANTMVAEAAPEHGLSLPFLTAANAARIRPTLPIEITVANPLDLNLPWKSEHGVSLDNASSLARCMLDAGQGAVDINLFLIDVPRRGSGLETVWLPTVEAMIDVRARSELPTIVGSLLPEGLEPHLRWRLLDHNVAPLMGLMETVTALGDAATYVANRQRLLAAPDERPELRTGRLPDSPTVLDEWASKQLLAEYGLPVPPGWAGPLEDAPAAAAQVGFPVAVKVLSNQILHKQRVGGVRLNVPDAESVAAAASDIRQAVASRYPDQTVSQILVERMLPPGGIELLIGLKRHPVLGMALVLGLGGSQVEALRKFTTVLLPASRSEIRWAAERIVPGLESTAKTHLLQALAAVQALALDYFDRLFELDINPIVLLPDGQLWAADGLVVLAEAAQDD